MSRQRPHRHKARPCGGGMRRHRFWQLLKMLGLLLALAEDLMVDGALRFLPSRRVNSSSPQKTAAPRINPRKARASDTQVAKRGRAGRVTRPAEAPRSDINSPSRSRGSIAVGAVQPACASTRRFKGVHCSERRPTMFFRKAKPVTCAVCGKLIAAKERRFVDRNRVTKAERHTHVACQKTDQ